MKLAGNAAIEDFFTGNGTDGLSWASAHVLEDIEIDAQGGGSAIEINDTSLYLVIRNCTLFNATGTPESAGIKLHNCTHVHVDNCSLHSNMLGLLADHVNNSIFSLNLVHDNFYGVQLSFSQNNSISSNTFFWNAYETLRLDDASNNTLALNLITGNTCEGIILSYSDACVVERNVLINNTDAGIYVFWSDGAIVRNNNVTQYNNDAGIYLYGGASSTVEGNLMNGTGIVLDGFTIPSFRSHSIPVSNKVNGKNVFYYVDQQDLDALDFADPGQIILVNCTNASMTGLTITNTTFGIMLFSSSGNTITGNTITHSMHGIGITFFSQYNTVASNNLTFNRRSGVNMHAVSSMLDGVEIFGNGRWCCGEPLFRMGLWDAERQVAEHLLQDFSQLRCKEMLVPCLAGYHLFTVVYPKLFNVQFPFDITPLFDWLGDRIMKGEITVVRPFHELKAALHDNCWPKISGNRFHASIRALLEKIGVEVIELPHAKENNLCCGMCAVAANYSITDGVKHGLARLKEAKRAGADVVIDYCGGCNWFMEVSKHFYPFKLPAVKHVMELLIEATGETCLHDNRWLGNLLFKETMKTVLPKALNRKRFYMKKIIIP